MTVVSNMGQVGEPAKPEVGEQDVDEQDEERVEKVRIALGANSDYYDVEIVNELENAQRDILEVEGCPITLRNRIRHYRGPYCILRSKLLHCQHVMLWDAVKELEQPAGIKSYCTNFFHTVRVPDSDIKTVCAPIIPRAPPSHKARTCYMEISICHLLTDESNMKLKYPTRTATMHSLTDPRTGKEFLQCSFSGDDGQTRPSFDLKRGRMAVKVVDTTNRKEFNHDSNFDLTQRGIAGANAYKLVLMDQHTRNCLSIVLEACKTAVKNGEEDVEEIVYNFCWIRYHLGGMQQSSPLLTGVPHGYPANASPLNSPAGFPIDLNVMGSPLNSPATMPAPGAVSWLRTPGTQVLKGPSNIGPGGGQLSDDKSGGNLLPPGANGQNPKLKQQYSGGSSCGPDTLFGEVGMQNSPVHSGLAGLGSLSGFRAPGMPSMTLNSPTIMPLNTQSPMYPYNSPNFYLQSPPNHMMQVLDEEVVG